MTFCNPKAEQERGAHRIDSAVEDNCEESPSIGAEDREACVWSIM